MGRTTARKGEYGLAREASRKLENTVVIVRHTDNIIRSLNNAISFNVALF